MNISIDFGPPIFFYCTCIIPVCKTTIALLHDTHGMLTKQRELVPGLKKDRDFSDRVIVPYFIRPETFVPGFHKRENSEREPVPPFNLLKNGTLHARKQKSSDDSFYFV